MITNLTIDNFQSIAHADLSLGAWTSLVGESDRGKSAVLRALTALLQNWRGDDFIRRDTHCPAADHGRGCTCPKACEVVVTLADGPMISWRKARGKSGTYAVDDGGDNRLYEKTSGEVPEEVQALLRVSLPVAGEPLFPGLQGQHDPAFLLADTARRRAEVLGEFDGSNIMLAAEGLLRTAQRDTQRALKDAERAAEEADAGVAQYAALPALEEAVAVAQAAESAWEERRARERAAVGRLAGLTVIGARREREDARCAAWRPAGPAPALVAAAEARLAGVQASTGLLARLATTRQAATAAGARAMALVDVTARAAALGDREQGWRRGALLHAGLRDVGARHRAAALRASGPTVPDTAPLDARAARLARLGVVGATLRHASLAAHNTGALVERAAAAAHEAAEAVAALAGLPCPTCGQPMPA